MMLIEGVGSDFVKNARVVLVSPNSKVILIQTGDTHKETNILLG